MPEATIAKEFDFHAAHRLPHHDGQCCRPHGHTYVLRVAVTGPVKPGNQDADEGMVLDFGILKSIYKFSIEPHVEHQDLNQTLANHPLWSQYTKEENGMEVPLTTCENLARWIHELFAQELHKPDMAWQFRLEITLWETPTSYASVGATTWREQ